MRFRLRTLLILLAILPPLLALGWWKYAAWRAEQARLKAIAVERQQALQQAAANRLRILLTVPANPAGFWQVRQSRFPRPQGERDYQFPPQRHQRLTEEEQATLRENPFRP